ncbi:MAG TPA: hypothetical protein VIL46_17930 [Gemmataceae bacterium]
MSEVAGVRGAEAPRTPQDICAEFELSEAAAALLKPGQTPEEFFDALLGASLFGDGIAFIARLLPKKQAVWWGCLCVWGAERHASKAPVEAALGAIVRWLREPTEENRRAVGDAAREAGPTSAAGMLASAAFLSEGSMSLPGQPEVLPKPHYTGKLVAAAVLAASRKGGAARIPARQREFLALAVEVYRGANTWEKKS